MCETGSGSATNNGKEALITFGRLDMVADENLDLPDQTDNPTIERRGYSVHCIVPLPLKLAVYGDSCVQEVEGIVTCFSPLARWVKILDSHLRHHWAFVVI